MHSQVRSVFLGPPGSGKNTIATRLKEEYRICNLIPEEVIKAAFERGSKNAQKAVDLIKGDKNVPDDLMAQLILEAVEQPECFGGFILLGFPRNIEQALELDDKLDVNGHKLSSALDFEIPDELALERGLGKALSVIKDKIYYAFKPYDEKVIDIKREEMRKRGNVIKKDEESRESVLTRIAVYHTQTKQLAGYYSKTRIYKRIDGKKNIEDCYEQVKKALYLK